VRQCLKTSRQGTGAAIYLSLARNLMTNSGGRRESIWRLACA